MADDIQLNPGTGGSVLATDSDGSNRHYQLIKMVWGGIDTFNVASTVDPIPVNLQSAGLSGSLNVAVTAITAGTIIEVQGDVAHDAPAAGNPVLLAAYASATAPVNVSADGDAVRLWALPNGSQVVNVAAGGTLIPGDVTNGMDVDVTRVQGTVTITGTVTANAGTGTMTVAGTVTANAGTNLNTSALAVESGGNLATLAGAVRAEDAASASAHTGIAALATRKATPVNTSDTDGDYEMLQMSAGRLWASATIDAALPAGGNNIGDVDVLTLPALPAGTNNIGDVDVLTVPAPLNVSGGGAQATALRVTVANDSSGVLASIGSITTSMTPGTGATNQGKAVDNAAGATDTGVAALAVRDDALTTLTPVDNDYTHLRTNNRGALWTTHDGALPAGTNNIGDVDVLTLPGVAGDIAHDSTDAGNPVKMGGQARTTLPTAVADTDRANVMVDDLGRIVTYPMVPRDLVDQNRVLLTSTTETTLLAQVAGVFLDLVSLDISNESPTEVRIDLRDATGGAVRWSIDLAADGGGIAKTFTVPFKQTAVNQNWTVQLSAAVSTVYVTVQAVRNN